MIKSFDKLRDGDKAVSARNINRAFDVLENVSKTSGADYNDSTGQIMFKNRPTGSGGGGASVTWAEIIEMPSYPNPSALPTTPEYLGRAYYTCRLLSSETNVWSSVTPYVTGDSATYNDVLYIAKRNNVNMRPDSSPDDWAKSEEIKVEYAVGFEKTAAIKLSDCVPWLEKGESIPLLSRKIDETIGTRYYIWAPGLIYAGTREQATLRYNPDTKITQAVFK